MLRVEDLNIKSIIGYGIGHIFNDLCANMWFSYLIVYMNKVVKLSAFNSGILFTIGQIVDAIATVFVGYWADRIYPKWYGRRMIWHLYGSVAVMLSFPFIFNLCPFISQDEALKGHWWLLLYYSPFIAIFQSGWAAVQTAHLSLIAELSENHKTRTLLNSIRTAMSVLSGLVVYLSFWFLLNNSNDKVLNENDYIVFRDISLFICIAGIILTFLHHILLIEPINNNLNEIDIYSNSSSNNLLYWLKNYDFYRITLIYGVSRIIYNVSQVYLVLFLLELSCFTETIIAISPLIMYLSGFITSISLPFILKYISKESITIFSLSVVIISCTLINITAKLNLNNTFNFIFAVMPSIFYGIVTNILLITSLIYVTDMLANNKVAIGFVMGSISFVDKFFNGIIILIIQFFSPIQIYHSIPTLYETYYRTILTFVPSSFSLFLLLLVLLFIQYPLGKYHQSPRSSLISEEQNIDIV